MTTKRMNGCCEGQKDEPRRKRLILRERKKRLTWSTK